MPTGHSGDGPDPRLLLEAAENAHEALKATYRVVMLHNERWPLSDPEVEAVAYHATQCAALARGISRALGLSYRYWGEGFPMPEDTQGDITIPD